MITTLNGLLSEPISDARLKRNFELHWPDLQKKLQAASEQDGAVQPPKREPEDMLGELLDLARDMKRGRVSYAGFEDPGNYLRAIMNHSAKRKLAGEGFIKRGEFDLALEKLASSQLHRRVTTLAGTLRTLAAQTARSAGAPGFVSLARPAQPLPGFPPSCQIKARNERAV